LSQSPNIGLIAVTADPPKVAPDPSMEQIARDRCSAATVARQTSAQASTVIRIA
jgi:hypothetical protein